MNPPGTLQNEVVIPPPLKQRQGSEEEGRKIRSRLRLRLGALNDSLVSGKGLHDACTLDRCGCDVRLSHDVLKTTGGTV